MQSDLDRERLLRIGVERGRVRTVGNIKFDRDWVPMGEEEKADWVRTLHINTEDPMWVAGSTHGGEEEIILDVFKKIKPLFPRIRLILAPRRIERAPEIHRLSLERGFRSVLRKGLTSDGEPYDVLVLDTMGELSRIYGIGELSFVGGSLVPIGGHNLLEPASLGSPVLFGPYTHNFVLMSRLLIEAGGGRRVKSGEDLFEQVRRLLSSPRVSEDMGRRAKAFVDLNRGALGRVMEHIDAYLAE
jgi:3-deoxy-D-manno-octulosonic-acid transferase